MRSRITAFRCLYAIVAAQQGFFTSKQAKAAGFSGSTHPYHVQAGNWVREHRGIYRLILIPTAKHPELVLWQLWSINRKGQVEGVYSHQTALGLHEFSDLDPERLHLTVPTHFRRSSQTPGVPTLHSADLPESDIVLAQGCRVTSPLRTILDLAAADTPALVKKSASKKKTIAREDLAQVFGIELDAPAPSKAPLRKARTGQPVVRPQRKQAKTKAKTGPAKRAARQGKAASKKR